MCEEVLRNDSKKPVLKTDSYRAIMVLRSEQELSACWQKISAHDKICSYDRQCRKRVFNSPLCFTVDEHTCYTIIRGKIVQNIFFFTLFLLLWSINLILPTTYIGQTIWVKIHSSHIVCLKLLLNTIRKNIL